MSKGLKILKFVLIGVIFFIVFGYGTMLLWNWLLPDLFNVPRINLWQSLGLLLLSKIIFSGFGGRHCSHNRSHWKNRYEDKLSKMSPEDRERFKARLREKWCPGDQNTSGVK